MSVARKMSAMRECGIDQELSPNLDRRHERPIELLLVPVRVVQAKG